MLSIDDLKKLADMQEKLLKISDKDRDINLEKYKDIVKQIDKFYFSNLLLEIGKVIEHNQTLEEELEYLEQISSTYEQVLVEQVKFRNVCELYGDKNIELSDLSTIDKEYIDSRKNVISGYLINEKNVNDAKKELDLLSGRLRDEEKKNIDLKKRLLGFEDVLRNNFINAEGRYLNGLNSEYVSVISEFKAIGYDFKELLYDSEKVKEILETVYCEVRDADDKLKTAELCYDKIINADSKNILDEITLENVKVKYKLTMIKILELLCRDIDNYDLFLKKRKDLFDLIKYRLDFVKKLGVKVSIDPFSRTKVFEQIKVVEALEDNSKNIHRVRKNINELNNRLEEMISMRDSYKSEIRNVKDIIIDKEDNVLDVEVDEETNTSMNDIVLSNIDMDDVVIDVNDIVCDKDRVILDNQVVSIRNFSDKLNMDIVRQKISQVIVRVNEMINGIKVNFHDNVVDVVPELVIEQLDVRDDLVEEIDNYHDVEGIDTIVDANVDMQENLFDNSEMSIFSEEDNLEKVDFEDDIDMLPLFNIFNDEIFDNKDEEISNERLDVVVEDIKDIDSDNLDAVGLSSEELEVKDNTDMKDSIDIEINLNDEMSYDNNIFMTVDPFEDAPLFTDRTDDDFVVFDESELIQEESSSLDTVNEEVVIGDIKDNLEVLEDIKLDMDDENEEVLIDTIVEDNSNKFPEIDIRVDLEEEMPDAFWTVQEESSNLNDEIFEKEDDVILSFDEQVALLREDGEEVETKNKTKVLKLDNNIDNKVA